MSQQILYHNKIATIHVNHSTVNSPAQDDTKMEKGELFVINQEISNTEA